MPKFESPKKVQKGLGDFIWWKSQML
jgi:hypothetical protein